MSSPRMTIPQLVWRKVLSQSNKKDNADLKAAILRTKITMSPAKDAILWEQPLDLLEILVRVLTHEETFTRNMNKGKPAHLNMLETIRRLNVRLKEVQAESVTVEQSAS